MENPSFAAFVEKDFMMTKNKPQKSLLKKTLLSIRPQLPQHY
jgi:hypothetical protein